MRKKREISQKARAIRSFYARKQKRVVNRWAKQYEVRAGILVLTCTANGRQYILRASNIRQAASYWREHVRKGDTGNQEVDADIARYGINAWTLKCGEVLPEIKGETKADTKARLNLLFRGYVAHTSHLYNRNEVVSRYLTIIQRTQAQQMVGWRGTPIDRVQDITGPVVFVLFCKPTKHCYICGVVNFKIRYFQVLRELRAGTFRITAFQEDWNAYGEQAFTCNFLRITDGNIREAKIMVFRAINGICRVANKDLPQSKNSPRGKLAS